MTVFPVEDGVLVVPAVLPIHVPEAAMKLTVVEWLTLMNPSKEDIMPEEEMPTAPYRDADVTEHDPDQSGLPQEPGSVVEDGSEDVIDE